MKASLIYVFADIRKEQNMPNGSSFIKKTKLCRDVLEYDKIAIYGAGKYAEMVLEVLHRKQIAVDFFVVSKKDKDSLNNIPVYALDECTGMLKRKDTILIIAANSVYEREIEASLKGFYIKGYLKISDYVRQYASVLEYQNKTLDEYKENILDWYTDMFDTQDDSGGKDLDIFVKKADDKKSIVFLIEFAEPRVLKLQKVLAAKGYRITAVISRRAYTHNGVLDEIRKNSVNAYEFQCAEEAMFYCIKSRPYMIHIFSAWDDCSLAYIFIHQKKLFSKVILERYDVLNGMYRRIGNHSDEECEKILLQERFCMEHADGICFRCFSKDFLEQDLNFCFWGKTLRFLDYYEKEYEHSDMDIVSKENELSLVYVGGIITEKEKPLFPGACFLELGKKCEMNKCHLHIYPVYWDEEKWQDYIELDRKSEYFHFHRPVEYKSLSQEISQYDYGIHPYRGNAMGSTNADFLKKYKFLYCGINKIFDYLSAGLPIIAPMPVKQIEEIEEKQMLLRWTLEEFDFDFLKKEKKRMKENVKKNRRYFMIENHIQELIDFYNMV